MKSIKLVILSFVCLFTFCFYASAQCTNDELLKYREETKSIKTSYDVVEKETETLDTESGTKIERLFFNLKFINVTDNLYIKVRDDYDNSNNTLANATDGALTIDYLVLDEAPHNLHYYVYTNGRTNCPNELVGDNYITLPQHNRYSKMNICVGSDIEVCQEYTTSTITYDKFLKESTKANEKQYEEKNGKQKNETKKKIDIKYFVIGGSILVIVSVVSIVVVRRVHEKRVRGF